jgi:hypothetical protein
MDIAQMNPVQTNSVYSRLSSLERSIILSGCMLGFCLGIYSPISRWIGQEPLPQLSGQASNYVETNRRLSEFNRCISKDSCDGGQLYALVPESIRERRFQFNHYLDSLRMIEGVSREVEAFSTAVADEKRNEFVRLEVSLVLICAPLIYVQKRVRKRSRREEHVYI